MFSSVPCRQSLREPGRRSSGALKGRKEEPCLALPPVSCHWCLRHGAGPERPLPGCDGGCAQRRMAEAPAAPVGGGRRRHQRWRVTLGRPRWPDRIAQRGWYKDPDPRAAYAITIHVTLARWRHGVWWSPALLHFCYLMPERAKEEGRQDESGKSRRPSRPQQPQRP